MNVCDLHLRIANTGPDWSVCFLEQGEATIDRPWELDSDVHTQFFKHVQSIEYNVCTWDDLNYVGNELWLRLTPSEIGKAIASIRARQKSLWNTGDHSRDDFIVRLELPERLRELPWESLYDRDISALGLAARPRYCIVHHPPAEANIAPYRPRNGSNLSMLIVAPENTQLDVAREINVVSKAATSRNTKIKLLDRRVTLATIHQALAGQSWDIVHYIGHGEVNARSRLEIVVNRENGDTDAVDAEQLCDSFEAATTVRLAMFNCCRGSGAPASRPDVLCGLGPMLMRKGVPAVVSMRYEIEDQVACNFARSFYESLLKGDAAGRIDTAMCEARGALSRDNGGHLRSVITPILHLSPGYHALFDFAGPPAMDQQVVHDDQRTGTARAPLDPISRGVWCESSTAHRILTDTIKYHLESPSGSDLFPDKSFVSGQLHRWLESDVRNCLVIGDQASGKSFMAVWWANHLATAHGFEVVLICAGSEWTEDDALDVIAGRLRAIIPSSTEASEKASSRRSRWNQIRAVLDALPAGSRLALVVDGLERTDLGGWEAGWAAITRSRSPQVRSCLFTRRLPDKEAWYWKAYLNWTDECSIVKMDSLNVDAVRKVLEENPAVRATKDKSKLVDALGESIGVSPLLLRFWLDLLATMAKRGNTLQASDLNIWRDQVRGFIEYFIKEQKAHWKIAVGDVAVDSVLKSMALAGVPMGPQDLNYFLPPQASSSSVAHAIQALEKLIVGSEAAGYSVSHELIRDSVTSHISTFEKSEFRRRSVEYAQMCLADCVAGNEVQSPYLAHALPDLVESQSLSGRWLTGLATQQWEEMCSGIDSSQYRRHINVAVSEFERLVDEDPGAIFQVGLDHLEAALMSASWKVSASRSEMTPLFTAAAMVLVSHRDMTEMQRAWTSEGAIPALGSTDPIVALALAQEQPPYLRAKILVDMAPVLEPTIRNALAQPWVFDELGSLARRDFLLRALVDCEPKGFRGKVPLPEFNLAVGECVPARALFLCRERRGIGPDREIRVVRAARVRGRRAAAGAVRTELAAIENEISRNRLVRLAVAVNEKIAPDLIGQIQDPCVRLLLVRENLKHYAPKMTLRLLDQIRSDATGDLADWWLVTALQARILSGEKVAAEAFWEVTDPHVRVHAVGEVLRWFPKHEDHGDLCREVYRAPINDDKFEATALSAWLRTHSSSEQTGLEDLRGTALSAVTREERLLVVTRFINFASASEVELLLSFAQTLDDDRLTDTAVGYCVDRLATLGNWHRASEVLKDVLEPLARIITIGRIARLQNGLARVLPEWREEVRVSLEALGDHRERVAAIASRFGWSDDRPEDLLTLLKTELSKMQDPRPSMVNNAELERPDSEKDVYKMVREMAKNWVRRRLLRSARAQAAFDAWSTVPCSRHAILASAITSNARSRADMYWTGRGLVAELQHAEPERRGEIITDALSCIGSDTVGAMEGLGLLLALAPIVKFQGDAFAPLLGQLAKRDGSAEHVMWALPSLFGSLKCYSPGLRAVIWNNMMRLIANTPRRACYELMESMSRLFTDWDGRDVRSEVVQMIWRVQQRRP